MNNDRPPITPNPITSILSDLDTDDFPRPRKRNIAEIIDAIIFDLNELKQHVEYKDGALWIKP